MPREIGWALKPADGSTFTGEAETVMLAGSTDGEALKLFYVRFAPGGRTHWHAHAGTQTLLVTEGRCLVQRHHHPTVALAAGDTITIPPHERHWHGGGSHGGNSSYRDQCRQPADDVARARLSGGIRRCSG